MCANLQSNQPAPREGYIPVDNAELYYRDTGRGQTIIVLHGGPDFAHNYLLPDMDRLSDSFRLIYYDQRGRGKSAGNVQPGDVSIASEIADLETTLYPHHLSQLNTHNARNAQYDQAVVHLHHFVRRVRHITFQPPGHQR